MATKLRSGPCSAQRLAVRPPPPPALPTGGRQGVDLPRSVHGDKTNKQGGTASDSVTVSVTKLGNEPPTVSLTAAKTKVEAGEKIRLTASATDDGTIASYEWSGNGAFNTTSTPGVVDWIAPSPPAETAYELKITVIDSGGASASATVTVTVGAAADPVPVVSFPSGASAAEARRRRSSSA